MSVKAYKFMLIRAHYGAQSEPLVRMLAAVLIGAFVK